MPSGRLLGDPRRTSPNACSSRPPPDAPSGVHDAPPTTYSDSPVIEFRVRVDGLSNVHAATGDGAWEEETVAVYDEVADKDADDVELGVAPNDNDADGEAVAVAFGDGAMFAVTG